MQKKKKKKKLLKDFWFFRLLHFNFLWEISPFITRILVFEGQYVNKHP